MVEFLSDVMAITLGFMGGYFGVHLVEKMQ